MNSEKIEVSGQTFRYPVFIGDGAMDELGRLARELDLGRRCLIIADDNSNRLFAHGVEKSLKAEKFQPTLISIPPGEKSKSLGQAARICEEMAEFSLDRSSFVVGLGGGVVGDLSGFVAAIFHRGIRHLQVPTTLLAMVDSAIGGKTAVNLKAGKNLIGAFHHPSLVLADIRALASLPREELRQGYAEIVKHGIIADAGLLQQLESGGLSLQQLVRRNILIKGEIVSADERDLIGKRAVLNFGHTIAHALERASNFEMPHGDCVSLGIVAACLISVRRAGLWSEERNRVIALLKQFGLPTQLPASISRTAIVEVIHRDKKFERGQIRFVVTGKLGSARLSRDVTMNDIEEAIDSLAF